MTDAPTNWWKLRRKLPQLVGSSRLQFYFPHSRSFWRPPCTACMLIFDRDFKAIFHFARDNHEKNFHCRLITSFCYPNISVSASVPMCSSATVVQLSRIKSLRKVIQFNPETSHEIMSEAFFCFYPIISCAKKHIKCCVLKKLSAASLWHKFYLMTRSFCLRRRNQTLQEISIVFLYALDTWWNFQSVVNFRAHHLISLFAEHRLGGKTVRLSISFSLSTLPGGKRQLEIGFPFPNSSLIDAWQIKMIFLLPATWVINY